MSIAAAGAPYGFNYVAADQQSGLKVAASIYDITTGTPVFVSKIPLVEALSGSYVGIFTPDNGKVYAIVTLVYTDPGLTLIDPDRAPGTETVQSVTFSGGSDFSQITNLVLILQNILKTLGLGNSLEGILETQELIGQMTVPELAGTISAQEVLNC